MLTAAAALCLYVPSFAFHERWVTTSRLYLRSHARMMSNQKSQDRVRLMTSAFLSEARYSRDDALAAQLAASVNQKCDSMSPAHGLVESLLHAEDLKAAQHMLEEQMANVGLQETLRVLRQLQQDLAEEEAGGVVRLALDLQSVVESVATSTLADSARHADGAGVTEAEARSLLPQISGANATGGSLPEADTGSLAVLSAPAMVLNFSAEDVPEDVVKRAMACQFWAPNHKLKGSWRFLQLGPTSRLAAARLSAGQAPGKADARFDALRHIPGCLVVVCKAFYETAGRREKEEQRALTAVHNLAIGLTAQGLGVKWVTGATTENYELWELIELDPNEEVVVGLLWYGWPAADGVKPVKDQTSVGDKLFRLP